MCMQYTPETDESLVSSRISRESRGFQSLSLSLDLENRPSKVSVSVSISKIGLPKSQSQSRSRIKGSKSLSLSLVSKFLVSSVSDSFMAPSVGVLWLVTKTQKRAPTELGST